MEIAKYFRRFAGLAAAVFFALTPLSALAQVYGSGTYGSGLYGASSGGNSGGGNSGGGSSGGGSSINIGPISLPVTGLGAWATWGTLALIAAACLLYWALSHRKKRLG